jgi:POT family proton-dependent oligopeptide transporter
MLFRTHHPLLVYLFSTELWERMSYYGMRAILILYAVKGLGYSDAKASEFYGFYTSFVYLTPLFGGYLADRYLGKVKSIELGCIFMMVGHLTLAVQNETAFFLGLIFLIIGNGFFKPNMSGLVGDLYQNQPEKKDSAYTIFYLGINLGGFIGPIASGYLAESLGWHYGFGIAGVGMGLGYAFFRSKKSEWVFLENQYSPKSSKEGSSPSKIDLSMYTYFAILCIVNVVFWTGFEQMGSSLNLFIDREVDKTIGDFTIPTAIFQSINPLFILLFALPFAGFWGAFSKEWETLHQFAIALVFLAMSYAILQWGVDHRGGDKIQSIYVILFFLFLTWGELCISPVGLSVISKISPPGKIGLLMGIWFLCTSLSHSLAGKLSAYSFSISYQEFFQILYSGALGFALFALGIGFYYQSKKLRRKNIG